MPDLMTLEQHVQLIRNLQGSFLDAYAVVTAEQQAVVAFNRPFFMMLPRKLARKLEGLPLSSALRFELSGASIDPVHDCMEHKKSVRYDEVRGDIEAGESGLNLIITATPLLTKDEGSVLGALLVLRNVTDEAQVQVKYKQMLRDEAEQRAELEETLKRRTQELLLANDNLNAMQQELMRYKKGLQLDR